MYSSAHALWLLSDNSHHALTGDCAVHDHSSLSGPPCALNGQVLLKLIRPYTRIRIAFIATELNIHSAEVEELLVALILDAKVDGRIDQVRVLNPQVAPGYNLRRIAIGCNRLQLGLPPIATRSQLRCPRS